jgi:hypothetical protein
MAQMSPGGLEHRTFSERMRDRLSGKIDAGPTGAADLALIVRMGLAA